MSVAIVADSKVKQTRRASHSHTASAEQMMMSKVFGLFPLRRTEASPADGLAV